MATDKPQALSVPPCASPYLLRPETLLPGFLSQLSCSALPGDPDITLIQARYNAACFKEELFTELKIPFPAHLTRAVKKRQAEYLASRFVVRHALTQFGVEAFLLENDADRVPVWPPGIAGSLSHTHQYISLLLGRRKSHKLLGVDCEQIMRPETAKEMENAIIHLREKAILQRSGFPPDIALTAAFSLKESLYKALYPELRQFIDFSEAEIVSCAPRATEVTLRLTRHFSPTFTSGRQFTGYVRVGNREVLSWVVASTD